MAYTKYVSKWIADLNLRTKIIKLLQENTGENQCSLELQSFVRYHTKSVTHKRKYWYHQNKIVLQNTIPFEVNIISRIYFLKV